MKTAAEILAWCVENNEPNDFAIMANYSGHVNWLSVEVYLGGFKSGHRSNLGMTCTDDLEGLNLLFIKLETLKHYNDQSSQWANELAENNRQRKIADLKLKLSELEG